MDDKTRLENELAQLNAEGLENIRTFKTALRWNMPRTVVDALATAFDIDEKRAPVLRALGEIRATEAKTAAETVGGKYKLLTVPAYRTVGRGRNAYKVESGVFYVEGLSYAPGSGLRYEKVRFTTDRAKALRLSTGTAVGLLDQLARSYRGAKAEPTAE